MSTLEGLSDGLDQGSGTMDGAEMAAFSLSRVSSVNAWSSSKFNQGEEDLGVTTRQTSGWKPG